MVNPAQAARNYKAAKAREIKRNKDRIKEQQQNQSLTRDLAKLLLDYDRLVRRDIDGKADEIDQSQQRRFERDIIESLQKRRDAGIGVEEYQQRFNGIKALRKTAALKQSILHGTPKEAPKGNTKPAAMIASTHTEQRGVKRARPSAIDPLLKDLPPDHLEAQRKAPPPPPPSAPITMRQGAPVAPAGYKVATLQPGRAAGPPPPPPPPHSIMKGREDGSVALVSSVIQSAPVAAPVLPTAPQESVLSAAPQVRDLRQELVSMVPLALRKKQQATMVASHVPDEASRPRSESSGEKEEERAPPVRAPSPKITPAIASASLFTINAAPEIDSDSEDEE